MIERDAASARLPLDDAGAIRVAVVMERTAIDNRWLPFRWAPVAIVPDRGATLNREEGDQGATLIEVNEWDGDRGAIANDAGGERGAIAGQAGGDRVVHPGFEIRLYRDEAEGYYLNVSSPAPVAFVNWELTEATARPHRVTLSYNEAARMMDGGAQVDSVPLPPEIAGWLAAYVDTHYRPESKKQRIRPPSFKGARRGGRES